MTPKPFITARKLSLITMAVLASSSVLAEAGPGWYIGGNVGRTRSDFDTPTVVGPLIGPGLVVNSRSRDDRDTGYKLYGGYQINRNFAIEGGFFDLGNYSYTLNTTPAGTFSGDSRVKGLNFDVLGIVPVSDRFSVFGRVGAAYARDKVSYTRSGAVPLNLSGPRNSSTNVKFGVGVEYAFTPALSVRGELERYRINDPVRNRGHIDMASVGLVYRWGARPQTVVYTPPPAAVIAAPPPPPARVVAPPPPPPPVVVAPAPPPAPVYEPPMRPAKQGRN